MRDKDARAVLRPLLPLATQVEATQPRGPRGLEARVLARGIRGVRVRTHDGVASALAAARADVRPRDVICVTGSVALVGEARDVLGLPVAERLW
jgi:dihydrofolate synthase/folylpolyglutamate synthase